MAITEEKALIKIASETSGAQIRYTINGEDPTESDTLYTSSGVELDYGDVLRAKAFKSGSMPSATSCYKNGFHNVTFEKVSDLDFLWNGTYERASYAYKGYEDNNDYIHKFLYLNGYYFIIGFDKCTTYKYSDVSSTGSSEVTYNNKTFVKYSTDLKTWKDMKLPETKQQGGYYYIYIPINMCYFNNKYIIIGTYYKSSSNPGSENTNLSSQFVFKSFSNSLYQNTEYNYGSGNYMLIYENVEGNFTEYAVNNETLGCEINNKSWSKRCQIFTTNKRLIFIGGSSDTITSLYTKDLITWESASSNFYFNTNDYDTWEENSEIFYLNGRFYTAVVVYDYTGSGTYPYQMCLTIAFSYDLKEWSTVPAIIQKDSTTSSSRFTVSDLPLIINDSLFIPFSWNGGTGSTYTYKVGRMNLINNSTSTYTHETNYDPWFTFQDSIFCIDKNSSSSNQTCVVNFNLNHFENFSTPQIKYPSPFENFNNKNYFFNLNSSINLLLKKDNEYYCIMNLPGAYNSSSGATLEDSWSYNKYSIFKINID